jgi:hypothetical protein
MANRDSQISAFYTNSASARTVNVPTNQVGDIVLIRVFYQRNVTVSSWPAGFAALTPSSFVSNASPARSGLVVWAWKAVTGSADSGTYSVTPSGATESQLTASSWSGRDTSASPFSFTTQNATANATVPPTLTGTAAAGDDLSYSMSEWNGTSGMSVSGFTLAAEDAADGMHLWKQENTSAGSKSVVSSSTSSNGFWVTLVAIKAAAGASVGIPDLNMAPMRSRF